MKLSTMKQRTQIWLADRMIPTIKIPIGESFLHFYAPSLLAQWRAETLLTKEPETIEWINGFQEGDILIDIGANVGCYSLYAALKGHHVVALEPSASNYWVLNRNIELNRFQDRIRAYCIAANQYSHIGKLRMKKTGVGEAMHQFQEAGHATPFGQGCIGVNLDDFLYQSVFGSTYFPNVHIKLDVDGLEEEILKGATYALHNTLVKSVLIEIHEDEDSAPIQKHLTSAGLVFSHKAHASLFKNTPYAGYWNWIFKRRIP